jgi:hypothetical protein
MKRTFLFALALCLTFSIIALTAFSANALASGELYPVEARELADGGNREIVRVYELSPGDDPGEIPREAFERGGYNFELTEIVKEETELEDRVEHSETVTVSNATKELEEILPLLPPTMEYVSEDGYGGILTLDTATLNVSEAGTEKQGYTMKTVREYPRLPNGDTSVIPKTVTERGVTYTLQNVDWQAGNVETIDYTETPEYYTAVASYSVSGSKTVVTGYAISAEYRGELVKISQGKIRYTAYFAGTPIEPEAAADGEDKAPFNALPIFISLGSAVLLGAGVFFAHRKLKGKIRKF